ncbi:hypothetical protein AB834_02245 [PVC group bacterium (ex Bugula neritina AB1)]|nr:hypothetical protein AB834_02245 [PVC group bacterium (ex Bugula neritina AB1)]
MFIMKKNIFIAFYFIFISNSVHSTSPESGFKKTEHQLVSLHIGILESKINQIFFSSFDSDKITFLDKKNNRITNYMKPLH